MNKDLVNSFFDKEESFSEIKQERQKESYTNSEEFYIKKANEELEILRCNFIEFQKKSEDLILYKLFLPSIFKFATLAINIDTIINEKQSLNEDEHAESYKNIEILDEINQLYDNILNLMRGKYEDK